MVQLISKYKFWINNTFCTKINIYVLMHVLKSFCPVMHRQWCHITQNNWISISEWTLIFTGLRANTHWTPRLTQQEPSEYPVTPWLLYGTLKYIAGLPIWYHSSILRGWPGHKPIIVRYFYKSEWSCAIKVRRKHKWPDKYCDCWSQYPPNFTFPSVHV